MTQRNQRIVVLGAGYAGLMTALRLAKKTDSKQVAVTLINAADTFNERVRNHQLATGQRLPEHPLSAILKGTRVQLVRGTVTALQLAERHITLETDRGGQQIGYDYLVYALGSFVDVGQVPGVRQYAYTLDASSAAALAQRLLEVAARRGRLLLVGGGNTGVEVVSELAETYPGLHITLVTRRSFARNLSAGAQTHIRRAFDRFDILFREYTTITRLTEHDALTEQGEKIPFDVCIWVGGFAVSDLAQRSGLQVNARGQILIDRAMRSLSHPEIYAVGDAAFPLDEPGAPVRMSLYTAIMMGAHGADCLAAQLNGKTPTAFGLSYVALGLSLGRRDGVFQFLNWDRDTPLNLIVTGRAANWLREFFVHFALWSIKMQRSAPWVFSGPGSHKLKKIAVASSPSSHAGAEPSALSGSAVALKREA
jgi:NADH dehydrogenase FAD-containing subunit